jgi:hypothetical protein
MTARARSPTAHPPNGTSSLDFFMAMPPRGRQAAAELLTVGRSPRIFGWRFLLMKAGRGYQVRMRV